MRTGYIANEFEPVISYMKYLEKQKQTHKTNKHTSPILPPSPYIFKRTKVLPMQDAEMWALVTPFKAISLFWARF